MSWDLSMAGGSTVEPGFHAVTVEAAEVKETKSGTGEYIKVKLRLENNQVIFHNFNTKNDNPKAVQIGLGQLKDFLRCSGKADPNNLKSVTELEGLSAMAKIKVEDSPEYGEQARVIGFKKLESKVEGTFI